MIDAAIQWLADVQRSQPHLIKALLAGTLVSTVCGVIGCFIILRRTAFLADALAHAMLAGVVCGYLFMKLAFGADASAPAMIVGSLIAGVLTVLMVGFVARFSRIKEDTVIGIMYTFVFAAGGVLLSMFSHHVHIDLVHFLTGQLLAVQDGDLWMMALVAAGVVAVVVLFFRHLQLVSFDRVMAASIGLPVLALDYLLTTCTSLVVVAGVNVVGVILVVGLLIIPAATAYLLCDRLSRMLMLAALFGWTAFLMGYVLAETANVAPGSAVVVAAGGQFFAVLAAAPRYGLLADWRRRRQAAPQQVVEDVLACLVRMGGGPTPAGAVLEHVAGGRDLVRRAIGWLERRGWLIRADRAVSLTPAGRREAQRVLRAHRLWETYLQRLGQPADQVHQQADRLEHVYDAGAVEYLDDKLGHPLEDPHGTEIPADPAQLEPGARITAAQMREGRQGTVTRLSAEAARTPLELGMRIEAGPRRRQGRIWTLRLPGGREIQIDHATADGVTVRLERPESAGGEPAEEGGPAGQDRPPRGENPAGAAPDS